MMSDDDETVAVYVDRSTAVHNHIKVESANAPDAARLLKELEDKALERIVESMVVKVPSINAEIHAIVWEQQVAIPKFVGLAVFKLNNKPFRLKLEIEELAYRTKGKDAVIEAACKEFVCKLAEEVLVEAVDYSTMTRLLEGFR